MVDGVLYLSTPLYRAAAIDARSGETLWVHDPRAYESGTPAIAEWRHRGLAYWENGGDARIVWGTGDGYLVAVDAQTGLPDPDFGDNGRVDLTVGRPALRARAARRPEPADALFAVAADGHPRHHHRRLDHQRPHDHQGGDARLCPRLRRADRPAQVGLPYRAARARTSTARTPGSTRRGATAATRTSGR